MGNNEEKSDNAFKMNICITGNDIDKLYDILNDNKGIKRCWTFEKGIGNDNTVRIQRYFQKLEGFKNDIIQEVKECFLIRLNTILDQEIDLILDSMNKLAKTQYMPLVLILIDKYLEGDKILFDDKKYKNVDPRLIKISPYYENEEDVNQNIYPILLRFCSIHNELGDRFSYGSGNNKEDIDLIDRYYPFNINIACIGRFGQGKSTGVNMILNEYKAKESSKGCSQTKELTFYQVTGQPIRILDIPGFESIETVKAAVEKFKECGKEINKLKDNLHIILYFINYFEERSFMNLEVPILEEIGNYKNSKVIYVITHSNPLIDEEDINEKIENINEGLKGVLKNSKALNQTNQNGILEATKENVVFVNFHYDKKTKFKKFGVDNLFKTIYNFFIQSKDYKEFNKLNNDALNEKSKL